MFFLIGFGKYSVVAYFHAILFQIQNTSLFASALVSDLSMCLRFIPG